MNLKLELEFSKADILKDVDDLKRQIDAMRPLPEDVEGRVMQKLRLDWNYHSNAIEGNRLNYGETVAFLMEGITAKGKPLKDHLDIRGHNEAINFLLEIVKDTRPISEADIRALHKMILVEPYDSPAKTAEGLSTTKRITLGEYKTSPNHVRTATGEIHYYATPEETPAKMQELMEWYGEAAENDIHPVVIAALFHHKFVAIHPFDDGNGRLSRILMNLILMQNGYPPVVVKMDDRTNYYSLLSRADVGDSWPFVEYIAERLQSSLELYLKAASGDDIDEDDDIDKKIALFRINNTNVKEKRSSVLIARNLTLQIQPLEEKLDVSAKKFVDLFLDSTKSTVINTHKAYFYPSIANFFNKTPNTVKDEIFDNLEVIVFNYSFKNFRNAENDFSIDVWIRVIFEKYNYKVVNFRDEIIFSKLYHEGLSSKEFKIIVTNFTNNLLSLIEQKAQNHKS